MQHVLSNSDMRFYNMLHGCSLCMLHTLQILDGMHVQTTAPATAGTASGHSQSQVLKHTTCDKLCGLHTHVCVMPPQHSMYCGLLLALHTFNGVYVNQKTMPD
jgi:hypothetical protein